MGVRALPNGCYLMFGIGTTALYGPTRRGFKDDGGRPTPPPRRLCHFTISLSGIFRTTFPLESATSTDVPSVATPIGRASGAFSQRVSW